MKRLNDIKNQAIVLSTVQIAQLIGGTSNSQSAPDIIIDVDVDTI